MSALPVLYRPKPLVRIAIVGVVSLVPAAAFAQASPFLVGANSLVANAQAWLAPFAVLGILIVAFFAMSNRMSWSWALSLMLGIVLGFGSPQIVAWIRAMFGV